LRIVDLLAIDSTISWREFRGAGHEVCRKHGISDATFYKWRSRYGGMEVSDARRLKSLEDENRRLKKLLAETMLDASTLREMLGKNF
jgi:putative transposase